MGFKVNNERPAFYRLIEGNKYAKIELYYSLGGSDYATDRPRRRGLYIFFSIVEREVTPTHTTEKWVPMDDSNIRQFIKELKRKSQKQMEKFFEAVSEREDELFDEYLTWNDGLPNRLSSILDDIKEKIK